jgi:site-specific DNA-methyltransferase (adenine-specific)
VVKNDVEYILFLRKGGQYRKPTQLQKALSMLTKQEMQTWFLSFWTDIKGASTRTGHPAPFPIELAERLIRMFSFAGDTVLDPFVGSGSTSLAALRTGRNSIGVEIDPNYFRMAHTRLRTEAEQKRMFGATEAHVVIGE